MHSHTVLARSVTELECYIYHRWFSGSTNPFGRMVRFLSKETTQCIITHHWKIFSVAIFFIKSDQWKKHSLYDDHTWFALDSSTFILNYSSNFLSLAVQWSFSPISNFTSFAHFRFHFRFNFLKTMLFIANDYYSICKIDTQSYSKFLIDHIFKFCLKFAKFKVTFKFLFHCQWLSLNLQNKVSVFFDLFYKPHMNRRLYFCLRSYLKSSLQSSKKPNSLTVNDNHTIFKINSNFLQNFLSVTRSIRDLDFVENFVHRNPTLDYFVWRCIISSLDSGCSVSRTKLKRKPPGSER